jgi:hypothetical protein
VICNLFRAMCSDNGYVLSILKSGANNLIVHAPLAIVPLKPMRDESQPPRPPLVTHAVSFLLSCALPQQQLRHYLVEAGGKSVHRKVLRAKPGLFLNGSAPVRILQQLQDRGCK